MILISIFFFFFVSFSAVKMVLYPYRIHFREEMLLCGFVEEVIFFFLILSLFLVWKLDRCRQATINFLFLFLYFFIFIFFKFSSASLARFRIPLREFLL